MTATADYLVTVAPVRRLGDIQQHFVKIDTCEDVRNFDPGQMVMSTQMSISKFALVGCSWTAVVELMHVRSTGWPIASNPTEELLKSKLLKNLPCGLVSIGLCRPVQVLLWKT